MKKLTILLMLFLTIQVYGQMTTIDTKYMIPVTKTDTIWCNWSRPLLKNVTFTINKDEIVMYDKNICEKFHSHGYKGRIHQIDIQYNDTCTVDYYICTNNKSESLQIAIYDYNSGERAIVLIYPHIEYAYSTRKITDF